MRIVITGATGNVGTALLRRLATDHDGWDITGVARRVPQPASPYSAASWVSCDLADPDAPRALASCFAEADAVVHLAWSFQPTHNRKYLKQVGVGGTSSVLHAAHEAGVPHLVHMSSGAVYNAGAQGKQVPENYPSSLGTASSAYSQDKIAAEGLIREYQRRPGGRISSVTVLRPGLIGQRDGGSAMARYALPAWLPTAPLRHLPVLPIDRRFCVPAVHADDVADAIVRVLTSQNSGTFNLAAPEPATTSDLTAALGARPLQVPAATLRTIADITWRLRTQPVDKGWVDLAYSAPLLDCRRAATHLGWTPQHSGPAVLAELVAGLLEGASAPSPVLRKRTLRGDLRDSWQFQRGRFGATETPTELRPQPSALPSR